MLNASLLDTMFVLQDLMVVFSLLQVVNFYLSLIQERSGKDGKPSVHVFNTFFYPTIMQHGHSRVKRWTKQVDIFSKDLIIIPVHLGMHWCLAVSLCHKKTFNNQPQSSTCIYHDGERLLLQLVPILNTSWKKLYLLKSETLIYHYF